MFSSAKRKGAERLGIEKGRGYPPYKIITTTHVMLTTHTWMLRVFSKIKMLDDLACMMNWLLLLTLSEKSYPLDDDYYVIVSMCWDETKIEDDCTWCIERALPTYPVDAPLPSSRLLQQHNNTPQSFSSIPWTLAYLRNHVLKDAALLQNPRENRQYIQ